MEKTKICKGCGRQEIIKHVCDICGTEVDCSRNSWWVFNFATRYDFCSLKHLIQFAIAEEKKTNPQQHVLFGKKKRGKNA